MSKYKSYERNPSIEQLKQVIRGLKGELVQYQEKLSEYRDHENKIQVLMEEIKQLQKENEEEKKQLLKRIQYLEGVSKIPNVNNLGPKISTLKEENNNVSVNYNEIEYERTPRSNSNETSSWFFDSVKVDNNRNAQTVPTFNQKNKKAPKKQVTRVSSQSLNPGSRFLSSLQNFEK